MPIEWVILAEFATCRAQIVRGGYKTAREAGCVRIEMERDPMRFADTTNLIVISREDAVKRMANQ